MDLRLKVSSFRVMKMNSKKFAFLGASVFLAIAVAIGNFIRKA
jgi:hypothetical protein